MDAAGDARQKWLARAVTKFTKPGARLLAEPCIVQKSLTCCLPKMHSKVLEKTNSAVSSAVSLFQYSGLSASRKRERTRESSFCAADRN